MGGSPNGAFADSRPQSFNGRAIAILCREIRSRNNDMDYGSLLIFLSEYIGSAEYSIGVFDISRSGLETPPYRLTRLVAWTTANPAVISISSNLVDVRGGSLATHQRTPE